MRSGFGARQRHHGPHRHQDRSRDHRQGVRSDQDRPRARPLHPQQGHQVRRAGQDRARFRARAGHHPLLRGGLHGRGTRASAGAGRRGRGRPHHRRRQPHLHLRRAGRVLHGRGLHRRRRGHGHGQGLVQGARDHQVRHQRRAGPRRHAARTSSCTSSA